MKPRNWDKLSDKKKREYAEALFMSARGIYIVSQALHYAIKTMSEVPDPYKEMSNIQDMEVLRECIFNFPILDEETEKLRMDALRKKYQEEGQ